MRRVPLVLFGFLVAVQVSGRESAEDTAARIRDARPRARAHIERRAEAFGIFDIDQQLREVNALALDTSIIFKYQQYERGVEVYRSGITVHVWGNRVTESKSLAFPLRVDTTPKISKEKAIAAAFSHMGLSDKTNQSEAALVIVAHAHFGPRMPVDDRLAWKVGLWGTDERRGVMTDWLVFVDAHEGTVIFAEDQIMSVTYAVMSNLKLNGMYGTAYAAATYSWSSQASAPVDVYLQDPCYGHGIVVWGSDNQIECRTGTDGRFAMGLGNWVGDANFQYTGNARVLKYSSGQVWNNGVGDGVLGSRSTATVAADTYGAMHKVFRFLDYTYHRAGLDGSNSPKVRALVHHPSDPTNWNSRDSAILVARETAEHYDMASLDVIAHELAHGLNDEGPKLILTGEPGKVSESTADMFAMLVSAKEWPYDGLPYRIGELTLKNNQSSERALTYMDAPALKPGTVNCYTPDIGTLENHRGAGPGDHMFYLLVYGGTSLCNSNFVEGIGFDVATAIWRKAFFSLSFQSGYHDLRQQFITAAEQYAPGPSTIVSSTIAAFDAVEIP